MVVGADDRWHAYGITHPQPPTYVDPFHYAGEVHDAEYQLFHCAFHGSLTDIYANGEKACMEHEKVLYPADRLYARQSVDLVHWGDETLVMDAPFHGSMESPCLVKRHGYYYLLWCLYDGRGGCYDGRTFVYAADRLFGWAGTAPVAMLDGHAPEILSQNGQDYLISEWSVSGTAGLVLTV